MLHFLVNLLALRHSVDRIDREFSLLLAKREANIFKGLLKFDILLAFFLELNHLGQRSVRIRSQLAL